MIAYSSAFVFALSQMVVWQVHSIIGPNWQQCVTVWDADRLDCLRSITDIAQQSALCLSVIAHERAYYFIRLLVIYFLPALIVTLSALAVLYTMRRFTNDPQLVNRRKSTSMTAGPSNDTTRQLAAQVDDFDLSVNKSDNQSMITFPQFQ